MYYEFPITNDPRQVFTVDMVINGEMLHAKVEIRYLPEPDQWVLSLWDNASGELLVNQLRLVCSYGIVNDLLEPFRAAAQPQPLGSLFVIRNVDEPSTPDPAKDNLTGFKIIMGDVYDQGSADV